MADPVTWIASIFMGAIAGTEVGMAVNAIKEQKKAMADLKAGQPVSPISDTSVEAQKVAAEDTVTAQRRMLLLSGGETDVTGGKASLTSAQLSSKVLLGA